MDPGVQAMKVHTKIKGTVYWYQSHLILHYFIASEIITYRCARKFGIKGLINIAIYLDLVNGNFAELFPA